MQVGGFYAHFTDCTSRLLKELVSLEGEEVRVWMYFWLLGCVRWDAIPTCSR